MSDSIRKAWLLEYLIAYAEQHGSQLSSLQPKKGKIQIINFRTLPESPEEWVWADVSDKIHFVTVRFTMEAVKSFNGELRNAGRRLTSRRWGVATIRCSRPFLCQPPTKNGKGLEEELTIALVVDQVEVAGSEGEAMFGDPSCLTKEEPMRRWLEGLRQGSGGNVLQLERIQREMMKDKEKNDSDVKKNLVPPPRIDTMLRVDVNSSKSGGSASTDKHRHKQWMTRMKDLGLVLAYESHKISEDQRQMLENVVVFGQDLQAPCPLARQSPAPKHETSAQQIITISHPSSPTSCQTHIVRPNTPSQWSASQRTNLGHDAEGDDNESMLSKSLYSPLKQEDSVDQHDGGEGAESEARRETPSVDHRMKLEAYGPAEDANVLRELHSTPLNLMPPTPNTQRAERQRGHSPSPAPIRNPVVLVADSDISQSRTYSQSLSLTQPSISQHSIPSQQNHQAIPLNTIVPESSHPKTPPILREQKRELPEFSEEHGEEVEPPAKRQRGSLTDEVVIEKVGHDAIAWKQPSFVDARSKVTRKEEATTDINMNRAGPQHPSQADPSPRIMVPRPQVDTTTPDVFRPSNIENSQFGIHKQARLKLGGWQPQKDLPNGPGIMTWESFNAMLLTVGRVREQINNPTTRAG